MISKIKDFVFINDEFFVFPLIEKIKTKEEYRRIFSNFLSLSVLQAANYILPLITLPYLVRVLGPEKFGLISFAQAFTAYFQIITDYGFNLSATREISINRENKEKVSEIFSSVMFIKFGLLFVSLIFMSVIVFSFNKFRQDWLIYYLTFGMVLGNTLFPVWFFQGIERMKYITFLNILAKLIFTIAIFVFVKQTSDYLYVPLLNSIGFITAGILSLLIIFKDFKVVFKIPNFKEIKYQLKEGWYIFISTVAISLYTVSNTFILGLFTNNVIVGYYSAAEKIVRAIQGLWTPVSQTIFPFFSNLYNKKPENAKLLLIKLLKLTGVVTFLISILGCLFASFIIHIFLGEKYDVSVKIFQILIFIIFAIGINNILGVQGLVSFGYVNNFTQVVILGAGFHIIFLMILVPKFVYLGPAIATVSTELFICVVELFILRKLKLL
jgi:PST family polysaccharide transporter